jgi:hypothetical protein
MPVCAASTTDRIMAIAAIALLFLMPVSARAGIREPHPHAFLQLAIDAHDGRLDHHRDDASDASHGNHVRQPHGTRVDPFSLDPFAEGGGSDPRSGDANEVPRHGELRVDGLSWLPSSAGLIWAFLAVFLAAWLLALWVGEVVLLSRRRAGSAWGVDSPPAEPPPRPPIIRSSG